MGWYVRTEKQLVEVGFRKNSNGNYDKRGRITFHHLMVRHYCGTPYTGPEPPENESTFVRWHEWHWSRDMLIWIPE